MSRRQTLLVVEDNDDLREMYQTSLAVAGFEVLEAASGLDALRVIDQQPPALIVLDLSLPHVSGFGVLYDLSAQAHTRSIPVIVVTGSGDDLSHLNVACVLRKPVAPEQLVRAVRACMASDSPLAGA